jgi:hypothetical protein
MTVQDKRAEASLKLFGRTNCYSSHLEARLDFIESRSPQPGFRAFCIREKPRLSKVAEPA